MEKTQALRAAVVVAAWLAMGISIVVAMAFIGASPMILVGILAHPSHLMLFTIILLSPIFISAALYHHSRDERGRVSPLILTVSLFLTAMLVWVV